MNARPRTPVARHAAVAAAVALTLSACASRSPGPEAADVVPAPAASAAANASTGGADSHRADGRDAGRTGMSGAFASVPRDRSIYFEYDSSLLSADGRALVQQHADHLARQRQAVRLEGNADERGSREYNIALGQRRAEAVRQAMALRGLPANAVEAVSLGEERPRCTEDSEACFASNRRVDIVYPR